MGWRGGLVLEREADGCVVAPLIRSVQDGGCHELGLEGPVAHCEVDPGMGLAKGMRVIRQEEASSTPCSRGYLNPCVGEWPMLARATLEKFERKRKSGTDEEEDYQ